MKKLSTSKQMAINMVAAIVSFLIGTGINFVLAPYLVKELGSETYGFIGLAQLCPVCHHCNICSQLNVGQIYFN